MIAKRIEKLAPSGIRAFFDLVLGMPDVISLGVGEPDFVTPWRIREKAITALEQGMTSYTSNSGLMVLRQAICRHLEKRYRAIYDPAQECLITVGVSEGLDLALRAILEPGDEVIVVSPYYVAYPALVEICGAKPLFLATTAEEKFKINPAKLAQLLKRNPKAIILNYPSNPTGMIYSRQELKELWRLISRRDTIVITDEAYDELTYDGEHFPFACLDKKARQRTIMLNGFSKGYAMTGFRVAFACGIPEVIAAMTKIHSFSMLCGPIVAQVAAVEALKCQREVNDMRVEYRRRRDFFWQELNRIGLETIRPQGAFYCFPSVKNTGMSSMDFAKELLFKEKVAVVPGEAFGREFSGYLRMSYANSMDNIKEAARRMERFIKNHAKK